MFIGIPLFFFFVPLYFIFGDRKGRGHANIDRFIRSGVLVQFFFFNIQVLFFFFLFFGGRSLGIVSHKGLLDHTIKIKTEFAL